MKPIHFIYLFIFLFAIVGYPAAYLFDREGMFYYFVRNVDSGYLGIAYFWTVVSFLLIALLNVVLGSHRRFDMFMRRKTEDGWIKPDLLWIVVFTASVMMNLLFFVKMDFSLPLLNLPENVTELLLKRIDVKERLNPVLFSLSATVLGPLSLILALFFIRSRRKAKIALSVVNFLIIGTFSLAKSSFIIGVVIVIASYSFIRPLSYSKMIKLGVLFIALLLPMFFLTKSKEAGHVQGQAIAEIVTARIIYGQWAALPFFFEMFEKEPQTLKILLPPYLGDGSAWERNGEEVAPRKVMRAVTGYKVLEGTGAGVAVTYFIGEAYAVGGRLGVLFGCLLVSGQIWMMTYVFSRLRKTPLAIYAYSWLIYKICMGLITGLSAFVVSSFSVALFVLFLYVLFVEVGREVILAQRQLTARRRALAPAGEIG
ncbi:MAG: hypothetical protein AB8G18_11475 [Gammaproteobacteria bacterium]